MTIWNDWCLLCINLFTIRWVLGGNEIQNEPLTSVQAHEGARSAEWVVIVRVGADGTDAVGVSVHVLEVAGVWVFDLGPECGYQRFVLFGVGSIRVAKAQTRTEINL